MVGKEGEVGLDRLHRGTVMSVVDPGGLDPGIGTMLMRKATPYMLCSGLWRDDVGANPPEESNDVVDAPIVRSLPPHFLRLEMPR